MKILKWFDGKKTYLGSAFIALIGLGLMLTLIKNHYQSQVAWNIVEMFISAGLSGLGITFASMRHAQCKHERKIDHMLEKMK